MLVAWAILSILFRIGLLVLVILFTVQTSKGDPALRKVLKFLGLCLSIVPIIGAIFYVAFRKKPSGYGEKCGVMALLGVVLYALIRAGGDMM